MCRFYYICGQFVLHLSAILHLWLQPTLPNIFIFFKTVILEIGLFLVLQVFQADFFKKMNLKPELQVSEAILEKDLQ